MVPKKNPKVDINRNIRLYFAIGLATSLFITWRALELKTYEVDEILENSISIVENIQEDIPITEALNTPPPPPPPAAPTVIEVVANVEEIQETVISSTETNQREVIQDAVVKVADVKVEKVEEDIEVPFAIIEDVPIFPGCETVAKEDQRNCFVQKVQQHIRDNFHYPEEAEKAGIQGKVFVMFIIDPKGNVTNITSRAPNPMLKNAAEEIIRSLPKMTPGKQRGRPVKVPYAIPISFKLLNQ